MKLYDNRRAPNPRRVRIFLAEKEMTLPSVQVDLLAREQKSEDFRRKNSLGSVPVLELDDGECIAESVAICRYLEELQPEPALFGRDARERARVEMWNRRLELGLLVPVGQVWIHGSPFTAKLVKQVPAAAEFNRGVITRFLRWLDGELAVSEFVAGQRYSVADITGLCTLDFATELVGISIDPTLSHLTRWHAAVAGRPSARA
jgi:glutathione S-transferase